MADDANWSKVAPALGGNPSFAESIDAGGAAGSRRLVQSTTATAGTGEAVILHTVAIERSDPRLAGFSFMTGHWRTQRELEIKVADGGAPIDGVVALAGLPSALPKLNAECGQK
jgi:hypothetical protein